MNQQLAVVVNQLMTISGISQARLSGFEATRASLEAKATPGGIPGPGIADAPALKTLEAEINAEMHILSVIGSMGSAPAEGVLPTNATGLLLIYLDWDVNDDNRSALGLPPIDPTPIPDEVAAYATTVVASVFGISNFQFAPLPKGSAPGATALKPGLPPGSNSPWGII